MFALSPYSRHGLLWTATKQVNSHDYDGKVWGIHWSTVNSPHKCQWRGAWMFSLIGAWTNGRVNNGEAGDLRRHGTHCVVTVMFSIVWNKYCLLNLLEIPNIYYIISRLFINLSFYFVGCFSSEFWWLTSKSEAHHWIKDFRYPTSNRHRIMTPNMILSWLGSPVVDYGCYHHGGGEG